MAGFTPQSTDTDLGRLIRDDGSDMHAAVTEVVNGGSGATAPAVADSTATTVAGLVVDHNALLAALRTRGVIS